jgi:hypothetical protein
MTAAATAGSPTTELLYCTFCRRDHHHVDKLVAGPGVYICDRCVALSQRAMGGEAIPEFPGWASLTEEELLATLAPAAAVVRATEQAVAAHVGELRRRGVAWSRIGDALGVSRQAAWERYASST